MEQEEPKIEEKPEETEPKDPVILPPEQDLPQAEVPAAEIENPATEIPPSANIPEPEKSKDSESQESPESPQKSSHEDLEKHSNTSYLNVRINLNDLKDSPKKSSLNLDIAESLFHKDSLEKAKFGSLKQKYKASELNEMREVPQINKKTHKILNNKKQVQINKEKKKKEEKYDTYNEKLLVEIHPQRLSQVLRLTSADPLNPTVMKDSLQARKDFQSQKLKEEQKKKDLIAKCKNAEVSKDLSATNTLLSGHQGSSSTNTLLSGHKGSQSTSVLLSKNYMVSPNVLNSRIPPPNKSIHDKVFKAKSPDSVIISEKYSQLTPYSASFKYRSGYNKDDLVSKSRPMVDYKIQVLASPN